MWEGLLLLVPGLRANRYRLCFLIWDELLGLALGQNYWRPMFARPILQQGFYFSLLIYFTTAQAVSLLALLLVTRAFTYLFDMYVCFRYIYMYLRCFCSYYLLYFRAFSPHIVWQRKSRIEFRHVALFPFYYCWLAGLFQQLSELYTPIYFTTRMSRCLFRCRWSELLLSISTIMFWLAQAQSLAVLYVLLAFMPVLIYLFQPYARLFLLL